MTRSQLFTKFLLKNTLKEFLSFGRIEEKSLIILWNAVDQQIRLIVNKKKLFHYEIVIFAKEQWFHLRQWIIYCEKKLFSVYFVLVLSNHNQFTNQSAKNWHFSEIDSFFLCYRCFIFVCIIFSIVFDLRFFHIFYANITKKNQIKKMICIL